jgi:hypothetical protein
VTALDAVKTRERSRSAVKTSGVSHGFVASIRTRQPRDGTVYTSVRYVHNGNAFGEPYQQ